MAEEGYPKASEVVIETVDKVQGVEYDIVILDLVVVKSPGFLDKNRLNVLFSRARCGLYVIGNYQAWGRMRKSDSLPLKAFATELETFRISWPSSQASRSEFYRSDLSGDGTSTDEQESDTAYASMMRRLNMR